MADPIEFRVLGPVEAVRNGNTLALGGSRQRALLALLLLQPGRPIAADRLVEELWHGRPPAGAATTLRVYVSRLRTVLGEEAAISGGISGYAIDVSADRVDAHRFEQLVIAGQSALDRRAPRRAAERLRAALELWRGWPFDGLADEGALRLEGDRLVELRLLALEERIEADLALGLAAELVDELETLVQAHPYRERLWRQLMLALYRAGRQADALAAYRRVRTLLDEELGLEPDEELKELEQAILRHEVPPARLPEERHNLPASITSFVGREAELAEIERLLGEGRLLTLSGVGGVGKTRLGLEAAGRALADFPDGVFFVDFSPLTDYGLVPRHTAAALDIREHPETPAGEQLAARLRDAELLLVLDNCEHVRDAVAELAHRLLARCPRLRVLATSREALGIVGEVDYPVPPLALPPGDADADELRSAEAVRLFLARARETRPGLADDDAALVSAGRICRDLDGLPLAIELAAARAKALSLEDIAARLTDRFRFLVSWRRLSAARHRTLREAIDWSYELLGEQEGMLLVRLGVFAGGFTLAAAAAVCLEGSDATDLLAHLVDASLVVPEERDGETRYRLLETVRQYANERLEERGETEDVRRRHAGYFVAFVEEAEEKHLAYVDQWAETLGRERNNIRAALTWSRRAGELEHLQRLAKGMWMYWWVRGELGEGRVWLEAALEGGTGDQSLRARLLEHAAGLAWAAGDAAHAGELAEEALALYAALDDRRGETAARIILGHAAMEREDFTAAEALFARAHDLAGELPAPIRHAFIGVAMHNLGSVAFCEHDLDRAAERYEAALSIYRGAGDDYGVALNELYLGVVAVEAERYDDAGEFLARALPVFREMGFLQYAAQCVDAIASLVRARDHPLEAVRLLGAANALRERTGDAPTVVARLRRRTIDATRQDLGEEAFEAAWAEGRALAEEAALDRAQAAVAG